MDTRVMWPLLLLSRRKVSSVFGIVPLSHWLSLHFTFPRSGSGPFFDPDGRTEGRMDVLTGGAGEDRGELGMVTITLFHAPH